MGPEPKFYDDYMGIYYIAFYLNKDWLGNCYNYYNYYWLTLVSLCSGIVALNYYKFGTLVFL